MGVTFEDLSQHSGLKQLDDYLLTRSYITSYRASRDDLAVYAALKDAPPSDLVNASRWYKHITALLGSSLSAPGVGVTIGGAPHVATREFVPAPAAAAEPAPAPAAAPQTPPPAAEKATEEDDDDLDLFGDETEEEAAAAAAREEAKKATKKPAVVGKSSVLLDVKPWDDETDMVELERIVRSVEMPGLLWGASKLQDVVAGIKKLTIMMTIVDDLVSVDNLIEDHLLSEPASDYIQSCDIAAFNKICKPLLIQSLQFCVPGGDSVYFGFSRSRCLMFDVVVGLQKPSGPPQFWSQNGFSFYFMDSQPPGNVLP